MSLRFNQPEPSLMTRYGLTPAKAIAIGVLMIAFIVVLIVQLSPSSPPVATVATKSDQTAAHAKPRSTPAATRPLPPVRQRPTQSQTRKLDSSDIETVNSQQAKPWPTIAYQPSSKNNPFLLPPPLRSEAQIQLATETEEERQQRLAREQAELERQAAERQAAIERAERERQRLAEIEQQRIAQRAQRIAEQKRIKKVIQELQQTGVAIVLADEQERIAKIGDRLLHIGDRFDGVEVVEIRSNGSVLVKPIHPFETFETFEDFENFDSEPSSK